MLRITINKDYLLQCYLLSVLSIDTLHCVTMTFIMATDATSYNYHTMVIVLLMTSLMLSNYQAAGHGMGAPEAACATMAPNPTDHGGDPQGSAGPFTLSTSSTTYDPGETLTCKH